ncbi:MAG: PKD domain-containing protein, partial [Candidatus Poseidoniaceae archaeon]|nr:PKD domain-containing protein [Candidatus Poseidoniaceae archaeon]
MRTFSSVFISVIFVATLLSAGVLVSFDYARQNSENEQFSASVDANEGTNYYTLIEIDEGDNNEEESVTSIYHEFVFTVTGEGDSVSWDFGDGLAGNGMSISHQYETPGIYTVTATSISPNSVKTSTLEVLVDLEAVVEVDNMECTCAPTAKDSVIDLLGMQGTMSLKGYVMVEHDGSSESCTLR